MSPACCCVGQAQKVVIKRKPFVGNNQFPAAILALPDTSVAFWASPREGLSCQGLGTSPSLTRAVLQAEVKAGMAGSWCAENAPALFAAGAEENSGMRIQLRGIVPSPVRRG